MNKRDLKHISIAIIGAGPVGLTIAAVLRIHGIDVRVIERNGTFTPYSKAIGIHARTLEAMHCLGISDQLIADGHPMHAFRLVEGGKSILSASFGGIDSAYNFVLGLPQNRTERRLVERLGLLGGKVDWQTTLIDIEDVGDTEKPALLRIRDKTGRETTLTANWLIGADGSRSTVRELADIDFPGGDYGKAFILGDVKIDWNGPRNDLQFFLSPHGYLLVVPMPEGMHRIIAQTQLTYDEFQQRDRPIATLNELQAIVDKNGPGGIRVHSPQWLTCAPFYHREAVTSTKGRVLLAGDAFHLFSPLGAQGLNTGFQDAFNVAWKLAYVEKGWADRSLINSYEIERHAIARKIAALTKRTTHFITEIRPLHRLARHWLTRAYNRTDRAQRALPMLLAGLMQGYGQDSPLSGQTAEGLPVAGGRIPHAWLPVSGGYEPLAARIHGKLFTLMLTCNQFDANTMLELRKFAQKITAQKYPYLQLIIIARETTNVCTNDFIQPFTIIDDHLGSLSKALGNPPRAMILVRPDGYCALSADKWSFDTIDEYFSKLGFKSVRSTPASNLSENSHV